jgi:hypothetical protein
MKMANKTAKLGTKLIKNSAELIQTGTERLGSKVGVIAKKSAPVVQKGLEGIFDTLKTGAKYTLNKAGQAEQSLMKSIRSRRRRRSRRSRKSSK